MANVGMSNIPTVASPMVSPVESVIAHCRIHYDRSSCHVNSELSGRFGTHITVAPVEEVVGDRLPSDDSTLQTGGSDSTSHNRNERKGRHATCCNTGEGNAVPTSDCKNCVSSNTGNLPERETVIQMMTASAMLEVVIASFVY